MLKERRDSKGGQIAAWEEKAQEAGSHRPGLWKQSRGPSLAPSLGIMARVSELEVSLHHWVLGG